MVSVISPKTGTTIRIVSDSWIAAQGYKGDTAEERRIAFASNKTQNLQAKYCSDEVFGGVMEALSQVGFDDFASLGRAPLSDMGEENVVELVVGDNAKHLGPRPGQTEADKARVQSTLVVFQVFNGLDTYQAVEGRVEFQEGPVRR